MPNGRTSIREFGDVKTGANARAYLGFMTPHISYERELLSDITSTNKEVKVVLEMQNIKRVY